MKGPLEHHFDKQKIAALPMDQRSEVLSAQNALNEQEMALEKSKADRSRAKEEVKQAEAELAEAKQKESTCAELMKQGDKCFPKVAPGQEQMKAANTNREAAQAKLDYYEARRELVETEHDYRQAAYYSAEARLELAKAKLAAKNGLVPPDKVGTFEKQYSQRVSYAGDMQNKLEEDRDRAESRKARWQDLQKSISG